MPMAVRAYHVTLGDFLFQYLERYINIPRHSGYIPPLVNTGPMVKVHHPVGELTKTFYISWIGIATVHTRDGLDFYNVGYDTATLSPFINSTATIPILTPRTF